jgi:hypothetical protein
MKDFMNLDQEIILLIFSTCEQKFKMHGETNR